MRRKIEYLIAERLPSMPSGIKIALGRRAGSEVLMMVMNKGDERVIAACLDNPSLTEKEVCKLINGPTVKEEIVRTIVGHRRWALRYGVRFALIRNFHTPMACAVDFIKGMKTVDLRDLYADPKVPSSTRPFIFSELRSRGEAVHAPEDEPICLSGDENFDIPDMSDDS